MDANPDVQPVQPLITDVRGLVTLPQVFAASLSAH